MWCLKTPKWGFLLSQNYIVGNNISIFQHILNQFVPLFLLYKILTFWLQLISKIKSMCVFNYLSKLFPSYSCCDIYFCAIFKIYQMIGKHCQNRLSRMSYHTLKTQCIALLFYCAAFLFKSVIFSFVINFYRICDFLSQVGKFNWIKVMKFTRRKYDW